jgi:oligopeptide transport system substrate-binding protein
VTEARIRKALPFLLLVTVLALVAAACGGGAEQPRVTRGGTMRVELSEPGSLDPPHGDDSEEIIIIRNMFRGLVQYDEKTAKVLPASATSWDVSSDAKKFTFHLRRDNKFANGEPVTADSFVRAFNRLTAKSEDAELAYHAASILGYKEHHDDGTAATLAGVRAVDDYTLEITLAEPDAEFVTKLGHTAFSPVPSQAAIDGQKPSWAEFPIGNGPFMMKEAWQHNQRITLVPNPNYYDKAKGPFLSEVIFVILADFDTAYTEWKAGNLDWTRVPTAVLREAEASNPGKFIKRPTTGINYLDVITTKPPFNNKLVRQAFSLAIDRRQISDAVFNGLQEPATGILPPSMPGYRKPVQGVGPCKYCRYDPTQARQLLQQSGVTITGKVPINYNAGAGHEQWLQAVAKNLKDNLGIDTQLLGKQPFSEYLKFLGGEQATGLGRLAWGMDYPTPDNFLFPLFHSKSIGLDNYSRYSNPAFDDLIARARAELDANKRLQLYQQAEDMVLEDLPIIPLWWRTQFRLARLDKFGGLDMDPFEDPTIATAYLKSTG